MSNIIEFRPPPVSRMIQERSSEPGQILFFTGIRYVRDEDPPAATDTVPTLPDLPIRADGDLAGERLKA